MKNLIELVAKYPKECFWVALFSLLGLAAGFNGLVELVRALKSH